MPSSDAYNPFAQMKLRNPMHNRKETQGVNFGFLLFNADLGL